MQEAGTAPWFSSGTKVCDVKKSYTSPMLQVYGTVSQATKGSTGLIADTHGILNQGVIL
jgi:hypothetical protein